MQTRDGRPASSEAAYTSYVPRPEDLDPFPATPRRVLALPCPTPPSEKKASLPIHGAKIGPKKYHRVPNWQRGVKNYLGNSQIDRALFMRGRPNQSLQESISIPAWGSVRMVCMPVGNGHTPHEDLLWPVIVRSPFFVINVAFCIPRLGIRPPYDLERHCF